MIIRKLQTNFTAGEITDELSGRSDLPLYQNGAGRIRNARPMAQGGALRRGGLAFCAERINAPTQHHEWIFNTDQTYQLLFTDGLVDLYDGVDGSFLQSLAGPWDNAMIGELSVYSQGDYAFIAFPDMPVQQVARTGPASFTRTPYVFDRISSGGEQPIFQPYFRYIRPDLPIRITALLGYSSTGWQAGASATLSTGGGTGWAGYDFFTADYLNTYLLIAGAQWQIYNVIDARTVQAILRSASFRLKLTEDPMTVFQGLNSVEVYDPFHDFGIGSNVVVANAQPFGGALYGDLNGFKTLTGVTDSQWYFATSGTPNPDTAVGGGPSAVYWSDFSQTVDWKEQMYSPARGWPHCVGGYQSRFILGGGKSCPNRLNLSKLEAPWNFDVGTGLDDESIQVGLTGKRTPIVKAAVGSMHLQIFTSEGEYYVPRVEDNPGIKPATVAVLPQTTYGGLAGLFPVEFDGTTLFVSKNASALRQLTWEVIGYQAPSLSFVAQHLLVDPHWLAVQLEDREQGAASAILVNGDGTLAVLTMVRSEKVAAWAGWDTQGHVMTACAVDNRAFFVVRRVIDGVAVCSLEKLDASRLLDCSVMGTPAGRDGQNYLWSGFARFANQPISLVVNGLSDIGLYTPDGAGHVSVPSRADTLEGGFGFMPLVRTLPPEMALPNGPTAGEPRRIVSANVQVRNTLGMTIRKVKVGAVRPNLDMGLPAPPLNGRVWAHLLGWDTIGQVDISQSSNGPFEILSTSLEVEF